MKKLLFGICCFATGFVLGNLYDTKKEDIKDILAKEKNVLDIFKSNPKNKGLIKRVNNFIKGGK